jgi:D-3-phosphoglycerate dehydrogenase
MKKLVCTVEKERFDKYGIHFSPDWEVQQLAIPYTEEALIAACKTADYLFVGSVHPVTAAVISACPHLKMIHVEGVASDKVDIAAAAKHNIPVCNNRATNNGAVAEHTIGLILASMRRTPYCNERVHTIGFAACMKEYRQEGERELAGKHVGLIGMGAIGREVAKRLLNWECRVSYYDAYRPNAETEQALQIDYLPLEEIIESCDIISLHVPVLPETIGMMNTERFRRMKKTAFLINTARGEVIDQDALAQALEEGEIAGAALDILTPEPAPADHVLLNLSPAATKRLIVTTHVAGTTDEAFSRMLKNAIENFERVERGEKPINIVNGL